MQADVERLFAEGAALYRGGKYRAAVEKFEEAYALFPEPNLLYNMARAYEALGEVDQALTKYRLCVSHPRGTDDLRSKAAAKVEVLNAAKVSGAAVVEPAARGPAPAQPAPESPASGAAASAASPSAGAVAASTPAPKATGSAFPTWGVAGGVSAGIGVIAGLAGGVVFALGASTHAALEDDLSRPDVNGVLPVSRAEAEQALADGTSQKTVGVAALAAGGLLVAASVPMFVGQIAGGE